MAEIDIFNIEPNVVTRDMSGKSFFIYGANKTGKTTIACKFPKSLLLGFEKGYGMIPGIRALPINKWSEAVRAQKQLLQDAKDVQNGKKEETNFKTVIIDTAEQAQLLIEKYVCESNDVDAIKDIPYGQGWAIPSQIMGEYCNALTKAGYSLVVISHTKQQQYDNADGTSYMRIQPSLDNRILKVFEDMVDIMAYTDIVTDDDGTETTYLVMRGNKTLCAGSRYPYLEARIPFTYEALQDAIAQAVDKIAETNGENAVSDATVEMNTAPQRTLPELKKLIKSYYDVLVGNEKGEDYKQIVSKQLGAGRTVSSCTEKQKDLLEIVLMELEDLANENGLVVALA